jgi:hypothetical protein
MTTTINGQLEIDSERGVIYFHASEGPFAGASLLRICSLPKPIPLDKQLDITHMFGTDWDSSTTCNRPGCNQPGKPHPVGGNYCDKHAAEGDDSILKAIFGAKD